MEQDLRSALLADEPEDRIIVEHRGRKVEVRPPTLAQQRYFQRAAKDPKTKESDGVKLLVLAVIECTYEPGTDKRVFERADEEVLTNKTTDPRTLMGKLSRALNKLLSERPEDIEGNSEGALTAS